MPFISSIRRNYSTKNQDTTSVSQNYDITGGDIIYTAGGYRFHVFTSVGDSSLNINYKKGYNQTAMNLVTLPVSLEYLVVAGGGSGGGERNDGG